MLVFADRKSSVFEDNKMCTKFASPNSKDFGPFSFSAVYFLPVDQHSQNLDENFILLLLKTAVKVLSLLFLRFSFGLSNQNTHPALCCAG